MMEQDEVVADDTNNTDDTVPAELTQESTLDLPADEQPPEENVRINRVCVCVACRISVTNVVSVCACMWFRFEIAHQLSL